jgi:hypothetical protein
VNADIPNGPDPKVDEDEKLTVPGCLLTAVSVVVIGGVALAVVMWRDPSGHPMPKEIAILLPIVAGALYFGLGSALLSIYGLRVSAKPEQKSSGDSEDSRTNQHGNH